MMIIRSRKPSTQRPVTLRRTVTAPTGCRTCTAVRNVVNRAFSLVTRKPK